MNKVKYKIHNFWTIEYLAVALDAILKEIKKFQVESRFYKRQDNQNRADYIDMNGTFIIAEQQMA